MEDTSETKKAFKSRVNAILNGLTTENEQQIINEFLLLEPNIYPLLEIVASSIHDNTLQNPELAGTYARLCRKCHVKWGEKYTFNVKCSDGSIKLKGFREILLSRTQYGFEKLKILHNRDRNLLEEKSIEIKRIDIEDKIIELIKKDAYKVNKNEYRKRKKTLPVITIFIIYKKSRSKII